MIITTSRRSAFAGVLLALALVAVPGVAVAEEDDSDLDQTIESGQPVVTGERELTAGHVDMGPRFIDGEWTFLIHDDVAKADANAQSVWRYPDETVFHILDEGQLTAPDDSAYSFLGAEAGSTVWVSPQTQNPDVVWVGWNTQDPDVMAQIDRGITLSLTGVQGPGKMTVFLQSGSFGEPQVLWDSSIADAQPLWVDVNTHTHANWAFTEPGVYLVQMEASATLIDGTTVSDTQVIRFAVGSSTAAADAFAATWAGEDGTDDAEEATEAPATDAEDADDTATAGGEDETTDAGGDPLVPLLIGAIVVVALGLVAGFTIAIVRSIRAKKRVLAARAAGQSAGAGASGDDSATGTAAEEPRV